MKLYNYRIKADVSINLPEKEEEIPKDYYNTYLLYLNSGMNNKEALEEIHKGIILDYIVGYNYPEFDVKSNYIIKYKIKRINNDV